jgi:hypothetical protein
MILPIVKHTPSTSPPRGRSVSSASSYSANTARKKDTEGAIQSNSELSGDNPSPEMKHKNSIFQEIIEVVQTVFAGITQHLQRSRGPSISDNLYDSYDSDSAIDVHSFTHWRVRKTDEYKSVVKIEAEEELKKKAEYWERYGVSHRMSEVSFDQTNNLMRLLSSSMNINSNPNLMIDYHPYA